MECSLPTEYKINQPSSVLFFGEDYCLAVMAKASKFYIVFYNSDYTKLPLLLLKSVGCTPHVFSWSCTSGYTLFLIMNGLCCMSLRLVMQVHMMQLHNDFSLYRVRFVILLSLSGLFCLGLTFGIQQKVLLHHLQLVF